MAEFDSRTICPLVASPHPRCFCSSLSSFRIGGVIDYCCDRFLDCSIFLSRSDCGSREGHPLAVPAWDHSQGAAR